MSSGRIGTISGVKPRSKYGMVIANSNNEIIEFKEKPLLNDYINGGFMVFNDKVFDYIEKNEMEHPCLQRLSKINELMLYKHNDFWYCVDTVKELEELNDIWINGNPKWKV